jgi:hypothetical protein
LKASWLHILASVGIAALGAVTPVLQASIANHPKITLLLGSVWGILGAFLNPPVTPQSATKN